MKSNKQDHQDISGSRENHHNEKDQRGGDAVLLHLGHVAGDLKSQHATGRAGQAAQELL